MTKVNQSIEVVNLRYPIDCDCDQSEPDGHVICSACGDDWYDCACSAADHPDVPWMLDYMGTRS